MTEAVVPAAIWTPSATLLADVRRALGTAPLDSPEARFESWAWQRLLDEHGPALLTRDCAPAHVTASAAVLSPDGASTCLVLHRRLGQWVQPGGHLEPEDPSLATAAAREVREETGLSATARPDPVALSRHRAPCRPGTVDWHLDVQHLVVAEPARPRLSEESSAVSWWPLDSLPAPLAPGVAGLIARAARVLGGSSQVVAPATSAGASVTAAPAEAAVTDASAEAAVPDA
ncbi:MAG: NUDIX domain-containing protein [Actinomycetales bacterium]|nr:NUDIX domain-containing protein [Actinomycetales bacterium]